MVKKKLLVFSDTHGHVPALKAVFNWAKGRLPPLGNIHAAAFLGDGVSDLPLAANATGFFCNWNLVRGNNDFGVSTPDTDVLDFMDHRFYMCHGHRHDLFGDYRSLINAAKSNDADAVFFGHSHVPLCKYVNGILLLNPGSVGRPRSRIGATFAVIECSSGGLPEVEFFGISEQDKIKVLEIY